LEKSEIISRCCAILSAIGCTIYTSLHDICIHVVLHDICIYTQYSLFYKALLQRRPVIAVYRLYNMISPPKNGEIALLLTTNGLMCSKCVSQKWNEAIDDCQ